MPNLKEQKSLQNIIMPPYIRKKLGNPSKGDFRVWWIPQIPGVSFYVPVSSPLEAVLVVETLARYDAFQYLNNVKGDYSNAGGLEQYVNKDNDGCDDGCDDGWVEWVCPDLTNSGEGIPPNILLLVGERIGQISGEIEYLKTLDVDWSATGHL